jgi:hypothetical protein
VVNGGVVGKGGVEGVGRAKVVKGARDSKESGEGVGRVRALFKMRAEAKRAAYSASATKNTTTGILVEWAETGWLMGESSGRVGWKE